MNRRGFLAALATLIAAPRLLAKLAPAGGPSAEGLAWAGLREIGPAPAAYTASFDFPFQYYSIRRPRPRAESFPAWERRVLG